MGLILVRDNDALDVNPPAGEAHLAVHGSDWLWAVTAVYVVSFVRTNSPQEAPICDSH